MVLLCVSINNHTQLVKFLINTDLPSFWQCTNFHKFLMRYKVKWKFLNYSKSSCLAVAYTHLDPYLKCKSAFYYVFILQVDDHNGNRHFQAISFLYYPSKCTIYDEVICEKLIMPAWVVSLGFILFQIHHLSCLFILAYGFLVVATNTDAWQMSFLFYIQSNIS